MKANLIREKIRPLTQRIGRFFGRFGSPDFYTCLTLLFGILAAYFLSQGHIVWAIVFLIISGFFDWVDGAVAKAYDEFTKFGVVFDSTVDKFTEGLIYLALAWFSAQLIWPAVLAMFAFWLSSYISKIAYEINTNAQGGIAERRERLFLLLATIIVLPVNQLYSAFLLYFMAILSLITALERLLRIKKQAQAPHPKE